MGQSLKCSNKHSAHTVIFIATAAAVGLAHIPFLSLERVSYLPEPQILHLCQEVSNTSLTGMVQGVRVSGRQRSQAVDTSYQQTLVRLLSLILYACFLSVTLRSQFPTYTIPQGASCKALSPLEPDPIIGKNSSSRSHKTVEQTRILETR